MLAADVDFCSDEFRLRSYAPCSKASSKSLKSFSRLFDTEVKSLRSEAISYDAELAYMLEAYDVVREKPKALLSTMGEGTWKASEEGSGAALSQDG